MQKILILERKEGYREFCETSVTTGAYLVGKIR